jgi:hypothetical protein
VNKKKQKNFWLLSHYPLVRVTLRPNYPQQAGFSKQAALFLQKSAQKTSSALQPRAGGEGEVSNSSARSAIMKFFCFFLFTKRRPSLPLSPGRQHAAR